MNKTNRSGKHLVELKNTFHATSMMVWTDAHNADGREAIAELEAEAQTSPAAKAKLSRIYRTLCGVKGCGCGGVRM